MSSEFSMSIVWVVLPSNGVTPNGVTASIFVAPRLSTTSLGATPFANWPLTLSGLQFGMMFEPGGLIAPVAFEPQYSASLWEQVFRPETSVEPFTFTDQTSRQLWSYPVRTASEFIDSVYASVRASSPTEYPSVDSSTPSMLTQAIETAHGADAMRASRGKQFYLAPRKSPSSSAWSAAAKGEQGLLASLTPEGRAMYLARRFFDRPASVAVKDDLGRRVAHPRPVAPSFDFHQKLAVLADHPWLMRKLGLLIDVIIPVPVSRLPESGFVKLVVRDLNGGSFAGSVTPRTAYVFGPAGFSAAPSGAGTDVRDGFIPLEDSSYFASQGEPDGDVQKFVGFANTVDLLASRLSDEAKVAVAPPPQPLPARRSAGFFVSRSDRATAAKNRFGASAAIDAAITSTVPPDLYAPDLLRGFRVDVQSPGSDWFSLHRRTIRYAFGSSPEPIGEVTDEGYLKAYSGTSDPTPDGPKDLYLHEILFGWEGWSLSVPRPGRRLMPVFDSPSEAIAPPDDTPNPEFPLRATPRAVPGSLMPLRFGKRYRFRIRAVDLGGNSVLPGDHPSTPHATSVQIYKRQEPVLPPALVPRWAVTEGESVEHLVIRSGEGKNADGFASALNAEFADSAFPQKVYRSTCDRHVAPPKTSQTFAEAHGDFDGAFAPGADKKAFFRLATREEGTFGDTRIPSLTVDDGYLSGNPNEAAIITPPQVPHDQRRPSGSSGSSLTANRGDALAPGEYVVCQASQVQLPYLPDSAAGGVTFFDPVSAAPMISAPWGGAWPDVAPFRLQLGEGSTVSASPVVARVAEVRLPPATMLTLEYSSVPAEPRLSHLAYALDSGIPADQLLTGRHWMLTPRRQVTLVHAVPKPLAPPKLEIALARSLNQTWVTHVGQLTCHSRSTIQVDLEARWNEVLDQPTKPLPEDGVSSPAQVQTGHAYQIPVEYGVDSGSVPRLKHEFHDTKHRVVRYTPVAQTRYKEYFPPALIADASRISLAGSAVGPRDDGTFSVLSSARPSVPSVLYVVPIFHWESSSGVSVRRGGGLRVYLQRPWYSSGEGELLAVVLSDSLGGDRASRWGRDPVVADGVSAPLSASHFLNAATTASELPLDDGAVASISAFAVEFNADRQVWFCDLQLDLQGAYMPFVQLVLARYQRESVKSVELSTTVRTEFAQLAPDRRLEFAFGSSRVQLKVTGPVSPNLSVDLMPRSEVAPNHRLIAVTQERVPGSVGEVGWVTIGKELALTGTKVGATQGQWAGELTLSPATTPGRERRVVVEEREYFRVDSATGVSGVDYRVIYLDTIAVP